MLRLLLFLLLLCVSQSINSQIADREPGQFVIQLEEGASYQYIGNEKAEKLNDLLNIYLVSSNISRSPDNFKDAVVEYNQVRSIVPNLRVQSRSIPNDKHYDKQWNLMKIDLEKAWGVTTGGSTALGEKIVVAVLDSGYDINIQDLEENLYVNKNEAVGDSNNDGCPGDCGVDDDMDGKIDEDLFGRLPSNPLYNPSDAADDDENGYVDDIRGLNLKDLTDRVSPGSHGTSVAGIIGAKGNNGISVSGVNWDIDLMLLSDVGNVSQIVKAYTYVYEQRRIYNATNGEKGANVMVTNFSSGIDKEFGKDFPVWCQLYDMMGSVGILSIGATTNSSTDVDVEGDLPSTCTSPYLIAVTNLTENDTQPTAGYGKVHVDIGAPGSGSVTLEMGGPDDTGNFSGTSAAAPHVAGAIALLHSIPCEAFAQYYKDNPSKVTEIKDYLLQTVDPITDLQGRSVSEGRVNVYSSMVALKDFCPGSTGDLEILSVFPNPSYRDEVTISYAGPDGQGSFQFLIFDVLGHLIHSENFNPPLYGEKIYKFTPPDLAAGMYYFVIRSEDNLVSHKQIVIPY
jgi:subtilisin family serine protease